MAATEPAQLLRALQGHREAIVRHWHEAIARTSFVPLSSGEVRQRLGELTDEAIAALLAESFERPRAEAIGAALARLHYVQPAALGGTLEALAGQLLAGLPAEQVAALQPRLAALLG